jgi:hypothetical protein
MANSQWSRHPEVQPRSGLRVFGGDPASGRYEDETRRSGRMAGLFLFSRADRGLPHEPEGYLTAPAACYRAYKREFSLPELAFPWEDPAEGALNPANPPKSPTSPP